MLFAAPAQAALRSGVTTMTNLVRPTLGPTGRRVIAYEETSGRPPEVLEDAATILRRVIDLPDPYVTMGAMILRHAVWQTHEAIGDGGATTAVLFEALVRHTAPLLAAGGNPLALRRGLEKGLAAAVLALHRIGQPLVGDAAIARTAEALCHDAELARMLGEIFDIVGTDGCIQVENGYTRGFDRQYVEGLQWDSGFFSSHFITNQDLREARLEEPAVLVSDLRLSEAGQLLPLLEHLARAKQRSLLIIADDVSGSALGLLVANHMAGVLHAIAVRAPSVEPQRTQILRDLAILTGGRLVTEAGGDLAQQLTPDDLGRARMAWATTSSFGLHGGRGSPLALRERISQVRAVYATTTAPEEQEQLRARIGKLLGGVAVLQVGGETQRELEDRKTLALRTITTLRHALQDGVAPGGGTAYLACQPALCHLAMTGDEGAALDALRAALEEPLAVIARNAGHEPGPAVARAKASPPGWGFDAVSGQIVDMWAAGILDPVRMLERALASAVSGASMLLTADVLVHHRDPKPKVKP